MKWFTKGEIFTSRFNFDLNQSASQGPREKLITFLLRGRIIFFYHVNRSLTISLLSESFS